MLLDSIAYYSKKDSAKLQKVLIKLKQNKCYKSKGLTKENYGIIIPLFNKLKLYDELEILYKKYPEVLDSTYIGLNLNLIYYAKEKNNKEKQKYYLTRAKNIVEKRLEKNLREKIYDSTLLNVYFALEKRLTNKNIDITHNRFVKNYHLKPEQINRLKESYLQGYKIMFEKMYN